MRKIFSSFVAVCLLLIALQCHAVTISGNIKYGYSYFESPTHAALMLGEDGSHKYHNFSSRLKADHTWARFVFTAHYQLQYSLAENDNFTKYQDLDDRRLLDLTYVLTDEDDTKVLHRLDRLNIGYNGDKVVFKLGRQAVSWGNGFAFNAMDIFNPFQPTEIDKDYKSGDDMLYSQYLTQSGNDWQLIILPRRDEKEKIEEEASSYALKFQGIYGFGELNLLMARHYSDQLLGVGFSRSLADLLWRMDFTLTKLADDSYTPTIVTNLDYSWVLLEKNFYGYLEYYHNGFGVDRNEMAISSPDLSQRLARSELFTKGKDYLAFGLQIELHPLLRIDPAFIFNLHDSSGLCNFTLQYDWLENLSLKLNAIVPLGDEDSEFNGSYSTGNNINILASYYF